MTKTHIVAWHKLQAISLSHASELYSKAHTVYKNPKRVWVPDVIKENCDILGRGTEEDVKARLIWYWMYYPEICEESQV